MEATFNELLIHPLLAEVPIMNEVLIRLASDAAEAKGGQYQDKQERHEEVKVSWEAFVADVHERGVVEPLVVVPIDEKSKEYAKGHRWWIIDGRHRFKAGAECGTAFFPIRVSTQEPKSYILGALCQRNHFSKQQRAFFALQLHSELVGSAAGKRTDLKPRQSLARFASRDDLADGIGVSRQTIDIAAKVHSLFQKDPAAKVKYLPLIYGGIPLAGVLKGDAATKSAAGHGADRDPAWVRLPERFTRELRNIQKDWEEMTNATPEQQAEVKAALSSFLKGLPADLVAHATFTLKSAE